LLDEKGVNEFFDAAKELKNESHNIDFSIAGSYDKTNKLSISQKIFEEIQNSNEIKYLGNVENQLMRDLYHSHDIFILPSYREGLPVAALEAASTGMPLIMPNVPGCNECIINDCNGYLIEPRSIESLKKAIKEIYKNKFLISKFSKQSRLIIEKNFEISIIGKKYKEIIELNMS
jgi:Glycosyltransferase